MRFFSTLMALAASVAVASAGTVTFWTLDDNTRTIHFTPNAGYKELDSITVSNSEKTSFTFPDVWIGNFYAVQEDGSGSAGMLGEVNFGGWGGKTYFDVSAIVDPTDKTNVKQMWPAESKSPMSGCEEFPCDNAYYLPDDVQTKVTDEDHIITTLGSGSSGLTF